MAISIERSVKLNVGTDRLHRHLAHILLTVECLVATAQQLGRPSKPDLLALPSHVLDLQVALPVDGFMGKALVGSVPDLIRLEFIRGAPRRDPVPEGRSWVLNGLMTNLMSAQFVLFLAEHWDWLRATYGHDYTKWPEPLNFARVIRNAASHGGRIEFQNLQAAPVSWRGITYDPKMNGKKVIGPELWVPDLLLLMVEVGDLLDQSGAPVL